MEVADSLGVKEPDAWYSGWVMPSDALERSAEAHGATSGGQFAKDMVHRHEAAAFREYQNALNRLQQGGPDGVTKK